MAKRKTIAEIAAEVTLEQSRNGFSSYSVNPGDPVLLDLIAERATHTNLYKGPDGMGFCRIPYCHWRILNALEGSPLFVKTYIKLHRLCRCFYLKDHVPDFMARN